MRERQDLGEARGKSETEKARQNLESEVLVRLNGLSEMSGLRPRSRDGRKSRTVTLAYTHTCIVLICSSVNDMHYQKLLYSWQRALNSRL